MWKRILSLVLAAALMSMTAAYAEENERHFGFEVLRGLYDGSANQVVSPVSLSFALAMAAQGAEGETKQEILDALNVEDLSELTEVMERLADKGLKQANAAFLAGDMTPREEYVTALREMFGAEWFENEGNVAEKVNGWVSEHTDGMIDKILQGELPEEAMLVLANAIAMDAKWMVEFDPAQTGDDTFHTPDGDVTVPFMHKELWATYGDFNGVQMLQLQYRNDDYEPTGLTMLIALPEEGGMDAVLDGLCAEGLEYFSFEGGEARVKLSMPKTDISADNSLNEILNALGVKTAFGNDADFSGITGDMPLKIGSVLQKARLQMDEEGTKAAAATVAGMTAMGMINPEDVVEFNMNRPFVAVIADQETGAVCFAAVVTNPISN